MGKLVTNRKYKVGKIIVIASSIVCGIIVLLVFYFGINIGVALLVKNYVGVYHTLHYLGSFFYGYKILYVCICTPFAMLIIGIWLMKRNKNKLIFGNY